jgi:hypothetical protein
MQYLLIDTHQRPLGTLISDKTFAVGDTFQNHNAETYTVVSLDWMKRHSSAQSIMVIPGSVHPKAVASVD